MAVIAIIVNEENIEIGKKIQQHIKTLRQKLNTNIKAYLCSEGFTVPEKTRIPKNKISLLQRDNFTDLMEWINDIRTKSKKTHEFFIDLTFAKKQTACRLLEFAFLSGIQIICADNASGQFYQYSVFPGLKYPLGIENNLREAIIGLKKIHDNGKQIVTIEELTKETNFSKNILFVILNKAISLGLVEQSTNKIGYKLSEKYKEGIEILTKYLAYDQKD